MQSLVDEDESNERGEDLLREPCEEPGDGTNVEHHQHEHQQGTPESNPHTEFQERDAFLPTEERDQLLHDEGGASGTQHDQGLARENGVEKVSQAYCQDSLGGTLQEERKTWNNSRLYQMNYIALNAIFTVH